MKCDYCRAEIVENTNEVNYGGWEFHVCNEECKEKLEKANLNRTRNLKLLFVPLIILFSSILISVLFAKDVNNTDSFVMLCGAFLGVWATFLPAPKPNHVRIFGYKKALLYNQLGTAALALIFLAMSIVRFMQ